MSCAAQIVACLCLSFACAHLILKSWYVEEPKPFRLLSDMKAALREARHLLERRKCLEALEPPPSPKARISSWSTLYENSHIRSTGSFSKQMIFLIVTIR